MRKMEIFIISLAEIMDLETIDISAATELASLEEWDSIAVISFIAFAKKEYNVVLKASDIKKSNTVADLFNILDK